MARTARKWPGHLATQAKPVRQAHSASQLDNSNGGAPNVTHTQHKPGFVGAADGFVSIIMTTAATNLVRATDG